MDTNQKKYSNKILIYAIVIFVILLATVSFFIYYLVGRIADFENMALSKEEVINVATEAEGISVTSQKLLEITAPASGDRIMSPVQVSGKANFFEGTVRIRVRDGNGKVLGETFTTAEGSMDKLYPFSKAVEFEYPLTLNGTVEVFETSPKDGSEINKGTVKVGFDYSAGGQSTSYNIKQLSYQNTKPGYSLKYNSDWIVNSSKAESKGDSATLFLTLLKGSYNFKVQMPSAWGPGVCLYSDSPASEGEIPIASQVEGDYVEIAGAGRIFRRSKDPQISNGRATWLICQKGADGLFSNATILQVISYDVPENYDSGIIKEMDDILKTINLL